MVSEKAIVQKQADTVFSYKNSFLNKAHQLSLNKEHPSQDENYFGLNSLGQATLVNKSNDVDVYFFNETNTPITISSNCVIGSINIPEFHAEVVAMNNVMTIAADSGPEATWLKNTPTAKLPRSAHANQREYVYQVLDVPSSPSLSENPDITGQLVDLIMIYWNVFYREGNCGGTDVMEHPVYTPKGLPPIRLKTRPINPGLIDALKEQIATWLKNGVIRSGGISPWNIPYSSRPEKDGKWRWVVDFRMLNSVLARILFQFQTLWSFWVTFGKAIISLL